MERWLPVFSLLADPATSAAAVAAVILDSVDHGPSPASAFAAFLLTPAAGDSSLLHTLPLFIQSRALSVLAAVRNHLDERLTARIAESVLSLRSTDRWPAVSARHLLDATPDPTVNADCFYDPPQWLLGETLQSILPWLPIARKSMLSDATEMIEPVPPSADEAMTVDTVVDCVPSSCPQLSGYANAEALLLKIEIAEVNLVPDAILLAKRIAKLCIECGNPEAVLSLVQPWEVDDIISRVLLNNVDLQGYRGSCGNGSSLVLCAVALPKLLELHRPASSALLSGVLEYCKHHPVAAVEALLFPSLLGKEGLNVGLCDVLTRVIKDCLHPVHVSAFCHRLLCGSPSDRAPVCLPQHRDHLASELVWTEPVFTLFYNILNQGVRLTPGTSEQLLAVILELASQFAKSHKFANFVLCFVTNCGAAARRHRALLERAAEMTDTLVTRALLTKLRSL